MFQTSLANNYKISKNPQIEVKINRDLLTAQKNTGENNALNSVAIKVILNPSIFN